MVAAVPTAGVTVLGAGRHPLGPPSDRRPRNSDVRECAPPVTRDERRVPEILVVCTGNLCRSPLAAAVLEHELGRRGTTATITSAGTAAPFGAQPDSRLLRVATDLGFDLAGHRSRPVERSDTQRSDLILVMAGEHIEALKRSDPSVVPKTVTVRSAAWRAGVLRGQRLSFPEWARRLATRPPHAEDAAPGSR